MVKSYMDLEIIDLSTLFEVALEDGRGLNQFMKDRISKYMSVCLIYCVLQTCVLVCVQYACGMA